MVFGNDDSMEATTVNTTPAAIPSASFGSSFQPSTSNFAGFGSNIAAQTNKSFGFGQLTAAGAQTTTSTFQSSGVSNGSAKSEPQQTPKFTFGAAAPTAAAAPAAAAGPTGFAAPTFGTNSTSGQKFGATPAFSFGGAAGATPAAPAPTFGFGASGTPAVSTQGQPSFSFGASNAAQSAAGGGGAFTLGNCGCELRYHMMLRLPLSQYVGFDFQEPHLRAKHRVRDANFESKNDVWSPVIYPAVPFSFFPFSYVALLCYALFMLVYRRFLQYPLRCAW